MTTYSNPITQRLADEFGDDWVAANVMQKYRGGKDFITYPGLLHIGHLRGMKSLQEHVVRYPDESKDGTAYAKSILLDKDGNEWIGAGDANPNNAKGVAAHFVRMACTRAKARALRDFTNVGMTALEEIEGDNGDERAAQKTESKPEQKTESRPAQKTESRPDPSPKPLSFEPEGAQGERQINGSQIKALTKLYGDLNRDVPDDLQSLSYAEAAGRINELNADKKAARA